MTAPSIMWNFSQGYILGVRQGKGTGLKESFRHESHAYPPALSDGGSLYLGAKSDLLTCLKDLSECQCGAPVVGSIITF